MVPIAMFGWIPICMALFTVLPARRAAMVCFLGGWLLLPVASYDLPMLPAYTKISAASFGALLGVLVFDPNAFRNLRFSLLDAPMLAWCIAPFFSSITNGLGPYDGVAESLTQTIRWGIPYLIGRMYFDSPAALRELAIGVFIAGLLYMPLCLWEIRMSPQLHRQLYGYAPHAFSMSIRFGGYRPTVFTQHGLALGMFMTAASLSGIWLWLTGAVRSIHRVPMWMLVPPLLATTFLGKSFGALVLLIGGVGALLSVKWLRLPVAIAAVALAPPAYMGARSVGGWDGQFLVQFAGAVDATRAQSIDFRLHHEDLLIDKALRQPVFGWGGWGRSRVYDDQGRDISITDGMWVLALGMNGVFGLAALSAAMILPVIVLWRRMDPHQWGRPLGAGVAIFAILVSLYFADCLFNAMLNPLYPLAAGGLTALAAMRVPRSSRRAANARAPARRIAGGVA
jgi:hypothetical protein